MLQDLPDFPRNDAPFVFDDGEGTGPSMVAFETRVQQHARRLQELGIHRLLWVSDNSVQWPVLELAALRAGTVLVPAAPDTSREHVESILRWSGCDAILADDPGFFEATLGHGEPLPPTLGGRGWRIEPAGPVPTLPEGTTRITFTRGTTGPPRGICHSARQIWRRAASLCTAMRASTHDVQLALMPLEELATLEWTVLGTLLAGSRSILVPLRPLGLVGHGTPDGRAIATTIERHEPTTLIVPPGVLAAWLDGLDALGRPEFTEDATGHGAFRVPEGLRRVVTVGAPLAEPLRRRAAAWRIPVFEGYGLRECAAVLAMNTPQNCRPNTVGRPLDPTRFELAEDGELCVLEPDFLGRLEEGGFTPAGDRCATGDLASIDAEGFVTIEGRKEHRIVTAEGRIVCPDRLEETLRSQPSVVEAFVFGDGEPHLAAVILSVPGGASRADAEVRAVNRELPGPVRLRRWIVEEDPLDHDSGTLTPAGVPNRREIYARHHDRLYQTQA